MLRRRRQRTRFDSATLDVDVTVGGRARDGRISPLDLSRIIRPSYCHAAHFWAFPRLLTELAVALDSKRHHRSRGDRTRSTRKGLENCDRRSTLLARSIIS